MAKRTKRKLRRLAREVELLRSQVETAQAMAVLLAEERAGAARRIRVARHLRAVPALTP